MSTPDPTIYPSTYYVELSPTEHGPALVASSPNLIIGVPEPIDGQIAGWVVNVPPVAGGWEIAEGAVAAHLYALSRGEAGDPNVTQVHPAPESGLEPARVVDGLTVGARYLIGEVDEGAPKPGEGDTDRSETRMTESATAKLPDAGKSARSALDAKPETRSTGKLDVQEWLDKKENTDRRRRQKLRSAYYVAQVLRTRR